MTVITRKRNGGYATVPNEVASDERLSFEARGLLVYLLAKPNDWQVKIADIMRSGGVGRDKAYRLLKELRAVGYVTLDTRKDAKGRIVEHGYVIYDVAIAAELPLPENPDMERPLPEKPDVDGPLPENPESGKPGVRKSRTHYKDLNLQNHKLQKQKENVRPRTGAAAGRAGFNALWMAWTASERPPERGNAERLWNGLPSAVDRQHALDHAAAFCRMMAWRKSRPRLLTYLRERLWRQLVDAPPLDLDGDFIITPDREEWPLWLDAIRAELGEPGVRQVERHGRIVRRDRWPTISAAAAGEQLRMALA